MPASKASEAVARLVAPKSIAVAGASGDPTKIGSLPLHFLRQYRYAGQIFPINPSYSDLDGLPCYPSLREVPGSVDLLVVAVPPDRVVGLLSECEAGKVKTALILTSGYAEVGPEGAVKQEELRRLAHEREIRLCGPNSVGCVNLWDAVVPTISQAFDLAMSPGPIAFVSQSGALGTAVMALAHAAAFKVGYFISSGNEADLDFTDFCEYFLDDPRISVIAGYLEGVRDGRKFAACARRALALGKPLVLVKVGRSAIGRNAARSHTGALVGADELYRAVIGEHGIVRVDSIEGLIDSLKLFSALEGRVGSRVALLSHSGGTGVLMSDVCDGHGILLPQPSPALQQRLAQHLPAYASLNNPIDMTANVVFQPGVMVQCLEEVLASPEFDAALLSVNLIWRKGDELADRLVELRKRQRKPFVICWIGMRPHLGERLQSGGVPVFEDPVRSVDALAAAVRWTRAVLRGPDAPAGGEGLLAPPRPVTRMAGYGELAALLAAYGIPLVSWRLARSLEEAREAARALGYPLVLKAVAGAISHKSDVGGVALNVRSDAELADVFERMLGLVDHHAGEGVLVQAMIVDGMEIFVGGRRDEIFGPVVAVGIGGIYVEVFRETAVSLAPLTPAQSAGLVGGARWSALLRGVRGQPPRDVTALVELVRRLSVFVTEVAVQSVDLNPVMVLPEGAGALVADFRVFPMQDRLGRAADDVHGRRDAPTLE